MMGAIEQTINTYDEPTSFEREMNTISWLLIRLMLVMVPIVFVINGLTDGDWLEAGVFALSVGGWFDSGNAADDYYSESC